MGSIINMNYEHYIAIDRMDILRCMVVELISMDPFKGDVDIILKDKCLYYKTKDSKDLKVLSENSSVIEAYCNLMNLISFYSYTRDEYGVGDHIKISTGGFYTGEEPS